MKIDKIVTGYLRENCYVISKNDKCLVVDPGDDFSLIDEVLKDKKVIAILLTHNHFDHVGAVEVIVKKYNSPIYAFNNLKEGKHTVGDFIFTCIYTPGHTNDSVSYYFEDEKLMFTGDFLFKESIGRWDLETGNYDCIMDSINKIKQYDNDIVIYPGHGEISTIGYEKDNNQYLFTD